MKIIKTRGNVPLDELKIYLEDKVNPLFKERRQVNFGFDFREEPNALELYNAELFDGFLFRIEQHENALHILKSEHYTDDVNVLALEDILNDLFLSFAGRNNIGFIGEES